MGRHVNAQSDADSDYVKAIYEWVICLSSLSSLPSHNVFYDQMLNSLLWFDCDLSSVLTESDFFHSGFGKTLTLREEQKLLPWFNGLIYGESNRGGSFYWWLELITEKRHDRRNWYDHN